MRLVVQRVTRAAVRLDDRVIGEIGPGAVVLAGISASDEVETAERMADKLVGLRFFEDPAGRTNLAIDDVGGALLVVNQFTLLADLRRGRRPGFTRAAAPDDAVPLLDRFIDRLRASGVRVETGRFGSAMAVELVNDGPFTLVLDSDADLGS